MFGFFSLIFFFLIPPLLMRNMEWNGYRHGRPRSRPIGLDYLDDPTRLGGTIDRRNYLPYLLNRPNRPRPHPRPRIRIRPRSQPRHPRLLCGAGTTQQFGRVMSGRNCSGCCACGTNSAAPCHAGDALRPVISLCFSSLWLTSHFVGSFIELFHMIPSLAAAARGNCLFRRLLLCMSCFFSA